MTLQQFRDKYLGTKVDWDKAYGGQCVDLYRQYVNDVLKHPQPKGVVGAADFWTNYDTDPNLNQYYDKIPNTPAGVPEPGDVVIWNKKAGGGYGHVAIFLRGDVNAFTSLDQNWPHLNQVTETNHTYTNVYGWLRPKGTMDTISIPKATFEELVTKATKLDAFRTTIGSDSATEVKQWMDDLKKSIADKNEELKAERERADLARKELNTLVQAAAKALNTVQEPNQIISALSKASTDLDRLDDLERTVAELQLSSGKEKELLEAEIARLKALVKHGSLSDASVEEMIAEIITRITNILLRR